MTKDLLERVSDHLASGTPPLHELAQASVRQRALLLECAREIKYLLGELKRAHCIWSPMDDLNPEVYDTHCGHTFQLEAGTPDNNHMQFCCYCGRPITLAPHRQGIGERPLPEL